MLILDRDSKSQEDEMDLKQRTLKKETSCVGIGLHTGKKVNMKIKPAPVNTGIIFIRKDIPGQPEIPVSFENVVAPERATNLIYNGYKVQTVEHLLAALYGCGIDNAIIEIDAPEVPAMDGSAAPFVFLIQMDAGILVQNAFKKFFIIKKTFRFEYNSSLILAYPSKELKIEYMIEFNHPLLRSQNYKFEFSTKKFINEISRARTFGFLHEVDALKKMGLAKGGSLDNAIVLDNFRVLNPDGLRFEDECVRHKILDFIGDIATLGKPVIGHFVVKKSGHSVNHGMLKKLVSEPAYWKILSPEVEKDVDEQIELPVFDLPEFVPA